MTYSFRLRRVRGTFYQARRDFERKYLPLKTTNAEKVELWETYRHQLLTYDYETQQIKTKYLQGLAEKHDIPVPALWLEEERHKNWLELDGFGPVLNVQARADLRAKIWDAEKRSWESWFRWVPLLVGLATLFAALFGIIAALSKWL